MLALELMFYLALSSSLTHQTWFAKKILKTHAMAEEGGDGGGGFFCKNTFLSKKDFFAQEMGAVFLGALHT